MVLARKGVRFGFLAYTFDQQNGNWRDIDARIAMTDIPTMCHDVTELRKRADVVIVSMTTPRYRTKPTEAQIAFAHAAIDAGAVLVVGHHPHVIQAMETYRSGLIFYSLGNFIFDQYQRPETQHGELVEISFLDSHPGDAHPPCEDHVHGSGAGNCGELTAGRVSTWPPNLKRIAEVFRRTYDLFWSGSA